MRAGNAFSEDHQRQQANDQHPINVQRIPKSETPKSSAPPIAAAGGLADCLTRAKSAEANRPVDAAIVIGMSEAPNAILMRVARVVWPSRKKKTGFLRNRSPSFRRY